tara:strand:+ start:11426 stop:11782 length:357 start_codon:yes stop_codon:yes gene_type:complete
MKSSAIFLLLLFTMVGCKDSEYSQVQKEELSAVFIMNSSPTFEGYYYEGSDTEFHYFSGRWKYQGDRKVKVKKVDLEINDEFALGSDEIGLTVFNLPTTGTIFCEIDGRPVYRENHKK